MFTKEKCFFSVIIPIWNVEQYLSECVDSVLNQSFKDFELILVDDGSPDCCGVICDEYKEKDPRVKVIHKKNSGLGGPSEARNAGLLTAKGEYIVSLDGDDFLIPDALGNIHNALMRYNHPEVLFTRYQLYKNGTITECTYTFDEERLCTLSPGVLYKDLLKRTKMVLYGWALICRRLYLTEKSLFFHAGLKHEDTHWVPRVMVNVSSFGFCSIATHSYRVNRMGSTVNTIGMENLYELIWIINDLLNFSKKPGYSKGCMAALRLHCATVYRGILHRRNAFEKMEKFQHNELIKLLYKKRHVLLNGGVWECLYWGMISVFGVPITIKMGCVLSDMKKIVKAYVGVTQ